MTKSRKRAPLVMTALLAAVLAGSALPAAAFADDGRDAITAAALGRVDLNGSSYAEVKQVNMLSDQNGKVVTFTLSVTNTGGKDVSFIDYWVRLISKSGAQFTVKMMPQDKDKNTIPAGSTQELSFYSTVNEATSLSDLKFRIIKWDFTLDNFERTLGEIPVPDDFTGVAPAGSSQTVKLSGTNMSLYVDKFTLGKNEKYSLPNVKLKLENVDNHSLTMPAYQFAVRTSQGYTYPMEAKGLKDLVINPQETKDVTLSGSVPISVSTDGLQLVITQNLADLKLNVPIAFFQLPAANQQDSGGAGEEVQFTDENGLYTAKMNGMYRLPWEDQDILTADLTVSNNGSDSLPVPNMSGYFLLDDAVKVEAKVVTPAKVLGMAKGSSVGLQVAAKVPYTYEFKKLKLVLQEKPADKTAADQTPVDVLEFETPAEVLNVPISDSAASFALTDPGYRSKFSVQAMRKYEGKSTDLYTAEVLVANEEKRYANVAKLVANLRAADGTVYPASVLDVKDKVGPGGKALLIVSCVLPKGANASGMNLLLGEAVSSDGKVVSGGGGSTSNTNNTTTTATSDPDMYVKPFAFWLPQVNNEVKTPLKDIPLAPYTLSIDHIGTSLENRVLTLKFDYEITKDTGTQVNTEGRKVVFQLNDTNGLRAIEWSTDLSSFEPQSSDSPDTAQTKLRVGQYKGFHISLNNEDLIYKLSFLKEYDFNIYEEFQGHRRLVGTVKNTWFAYSQD
ncbi:hypothetical protein [Gordoniibacillus kamchatkensis]|nr:hypothetical protein [Paenibacillus sp. VKM B-2647]